MSTIFCVAEPHDRAVAVIFGDLLDREVEVLVAGGDEFVFGGFFFSFGSHKWGSLGTCGNDCAK